MVIRFSRHRLCRHCKRNIGGLCSLLRASQGAWAGLLDSRATEQAGEAYRYRGGASSICTAVKPDRVVAA